MRTCSQGRWVPFFKVRNRAKEKKELASAIGEEGLTEEIKNGTVLLVTGFDNGENASPKRLLVGCTAHPDDTGLPNKRSRRCGRSTSANQPSTF
jgi:hypothetical protein